MLPSAEVLFPVHALSQCCDSLRPQERPCSTRVWCRTPGSALRGCSLVALGTGSRPGLAHAAALRSCFELRLQRVGPCPSSSSCCIAAVPVPGRSCCRCRPRLGPAALCPSRLSGHCSLARRPLGSA